MTVVQLIKLNVYYRTNFVLFFIDPTPTEIYTLSLHDALPISECFPNIGALGLLNTGESNHVHSDHQRRAWLLRSEEHTSELQSPDHLVCRLLLEKKKLISCSALSRARAEMQCRRTTSNRASLS